MAKQEAKRLELAEVQQWLTSWREQHGGRGRPIPDELWEAAVDVAGTYGVASTAHRLGLDRARLERRMGSRHDVAVPRQSSALTKFVELGLLGAGNSAVRDQVVVHITEQAGSALKLSIQGSAVVGGKGEGHPN
jgi:hypothetical protein